MKISKKRKIIAMVLIIVIVSNLTILISKQKFIKEMSKLSVDISKQLVYGAGDPTITNYEERVKTGIGHCGDFAYLLSKTLYERNIDYKVVDLKSSYKDARHTVVTVNYYGEIVIDPTLGIIYTAGLNKIISDSENLNKYKINPQNVESPYSDIEFYKKINGEGIFIYEENPFGFIE